MVLFLSTPTKYNPELAHDHVVLTNEITSDDGNRVFLLTPYSSTRDKKGKRKRNIDGTRTLKPHSHKVLRESFMAYSYTKLLTAKQINQRLEKYRRFYDDEIIDDLCVGLLESKQTDSKYKTFYRKYVLKQEEGY